MNATQELKNFMEHYGYEGQLAILVYLEEQGFIISEPEEDDEEETDDEYFEYLK